MIIRMLLALALFGGALGPLAATADQAQDDQVACMSDATALCGQYIPDRERVAACLIANKSHISVACRSALTRFNPAKPASPRNNAMR